MAILIQSNGEHREIAPINGTDFKLEELQRYVGGFIEVLNLEDGYILVINEEGKLHGLDPNENATLLWILSGGADVVVGDVVFCKTEGVQ